MNPISQAIKSPTKFTIFPTPVRGNANGISEFIQFLYHFYFGFDRWVKNGSFRYFRCILSTLGNRAGQGVFFGKPDGRGRAWSGFVRPVHDVKDIEVVAGVIVDSTDKGEVLFISKIGRAAPARPSRIPSRLWCALIDSSRPNFPVWVYRKRLIGL